MAYEAIDIIYEEIRAVILALNIKEAKEYFDFDNIPDSLTDNAFVLAPFDFDQGDFKRPDNRYPVYNLKAAIKVNISYVLPSNNIIQTMKVLMKKVEDIIKAILAITTGEDEKDNIIFNSANSRVDGNKLIYEILFNLNYRVKNI